MSKANAHSFPKGAGGAWFAPALAVVIGALLYWKPFESAPTPEDVFVASGPHLAGTLELGSGSRMRVSLEPLHADARRQEFDGIALARRLGLAAGEPWRLSLEAVGEVPEAALEGVEVVDGEGSCLAPILDRVVRAKGEVQDPLLGLFRPSRPSEQSPHFELVLWGRAPGDGARFLCTWGQTVLSEEEMEDEELRVVDGGPIPSGGTQDR